MSPESHVLGLVLRFKLFPPGSANLYRFDGAQVGLAVVLDLLVALLASIAGAWEADGSCCGAFLDVIPGVLCVVGAVFVMWRESLPDDPLRGPRQTAGDLGFAVW